MKIVLDLAISADGFIARQNGDSDWVAASTEELFKSRVQEAGCLVVGRKTFEQYRGSIYPIENALNIVLSKEEHGSDPSNVEYAASPELAVMLAKERGCVGILIAGGGTISGAFLKAGLIDEMFFSVHPLLLTEGIKPFENANVRINLTLLDSKELGEGVTQLHYRVLA